MTKKWGKKERKIEKIEKHKNRKIKKIGKSKQKQYLLNHNVDSKMRHFDANLIHEI